MLDGDVAEAGAGEGGLRGVVGADAERVEAAEQGGEDDPGVSNGRGPWEQVEGVSRRIAVEEDGDCLDSREKRREQRQGGQRDRCSRGGGNKLIQRRRRC